jgi:starch synthase (maltosyl-transferring)
MDGVALPRIVIDDVRPRTPTGEFPAKAVVGETVRVSADMFKDGHDAIGGRVLWHHVDKPTWEEAPLRHVGNDRWEAVIEPTALGAHEFAVEAWTAAYETWHHKITVKVDAGQDVSVELEEGARLFERAAGAVGDGEAQALEAAAAQLRDQGIASVRDRLAPALAPDLAELLGRPLPSDDVTRTREYGLWVDRERALSGAWYEVFPRSEGGFKGLVDRLPDIADMGFDVVYLPPVHPIGVTARKGKNNRPKATPGDVGSPWAIGGAEGGHDSIHPGLGTVEDFERFVQRAATLGIDVAIDLAFQCSPDHP